jgi:hypothetical protein
MTDSQKLGLLANLNRMKAQQKIHMEQFEPSDYRQVHALYLQAFDDEELANKARANAMDLYVDRAIRGARGR